MNLSAEKNKQRFIAYHESHQSKAAQKLHLDIRKLAKKGICKIFVEELDNSINLDYLRFLGYRATVQHGTEAGNSHQGKVEITWYPRL